MARRPKVQVIPIDNSSLHEQIAALANALWHERGCPQGSPDVDWLAAEQQIKQRRKAEIVTVLQGVRRRGVPA